MMNIDRGRNLAIMPLNIQFVLSYRTNTYTDTILEYKQAGDLGPYSDKPNPPQYVYPNFVTITIYIRLEISHFRR